jgi:broad specificity phosphatase PhoE
LSEGTGPLEPPVDRRLYLVRHGESDALTVDGHMRCEDPIPLTPRGREQGAALGELFAGLEVEVWSSPMDRTTATARLLAGGGREVHLHPRLREVSIGDLDGAHCRDIFAAAPGWLEDPDVGLPGGESLRDVATRVTEALEEILTESASRDVVVVGHGAVNRSLIASLLGMPLKRAHRIRQDWACVNVLDRADGRWWAGTINHTIIGVGEFALARGARLDDETWRRIRAVTGARPA